MSTTQKKRVLIFSLMYYPRFIAGAEIAIKEVTDRLSEVCEFDMITLRCDSNLPKFERIGNVNVYRIGPSKKAIRLDELGRFPWYLIKVLYPLLSAWKAMRLHRSKHYDLLWSIMTYMGLPGAFLKWRNPKLKFILTLQDGDSMSHIMDRKRIRPIRPFVRKVFLRADAVQSISTFLSSFARRMGHAKDLVVIPNGVSAELFSMRDKKNEEALRQKFDIKEGEKIIITTSRLVEKNAVADLISALTFLPHNVRLLIVGEGILEGKLKKQVHDLELTERVIFAGFVPHENLPSYLHVSHVFARPSLTEGMGISFIEAMAAGIPVVTTAVGGIPDFLKDRETGLFVEVKNPQDIAKKIELLLNDEMVRAHVVEQAKNMVQSKYDWNIVAQAMEKLFIRILS